MIPVIIRKIQLSVKQDRCILHMCLTNRRTSSEIGNVSFGSVCTADNAESFVAGSLNGQQAADGSSLIYPVNALTEEGSGKAGMDGALAYEWHALSNDKIWVINTHTAVPQSINGCRAICVRESEVVYKLAEKTLDAEIKAGHYVGGSRLMFCSREKPMVL